MASVALTPPSPLEAVAAALTAAAAASTGAAAAQTLAQPSGGSVSVAELPDDGRRVVARAVAAVAQLPTAPAATFSPVALEQATPPIDLLQPAGRPPPVALAAAAAAAPVAPPPAPLAPAAPLASQSAAPARAAAAAPSPPPPPVVPTAPVVTADGPLPVPGVPASSPFFEPDACSACRQRWREDEAEEAAATAAWDEEDGNGSGGSSSDIGSPVSNASSVASTCSVEAVHGDPDASAGAGGVAHSLLSSVAAAAGCPTGPRRGSFSRPTGSRTTTGDADAEGEGAADERFASLPRASGGASGGHHHHPAVHPHGFPFPHTYCYGTSANGSSKVPPPWALKAGTAAQMQGCGAGGAAAGTHMMPPPPRVQWHQRARGHHHDHHSSGGGGAAVCTTCGNALPSAGGGASAASASGGGSSGTTTTTRPYLAPGGPGGSTVPPGKRFFTVCDVRRHRYLHDCWLAAYGTVYDVTPFIDHHPGGRGSILRHAGSSTCELDFDFHSSGAQALWRDYAIGRLRPCPGSKGVPGASGGGGGGDDGWLGGCTVQ